jgi:UDPglucose 6-dehydrogenase
MIYVIGLGFVGLTTAVGLSYMGEKVIGIDNNKKIVKKLLKKEIHFHEPYLKDYLNKAFKKKLLSLQNNIDFENKENYFFVCVGTPSKSNGSVDLSIIENVVNEIVKKIKAKKIKSKNYIIIKSTVVPGTLESLEKKFKECKELYFASNPEFLREGYAWKDFISPDKIVIGSKNTITQNKIKKIYKKFNSNFFLLSDNASEFLKYLSNTALANMISFSNEMLMIAEKNKITEINKVFKGFHADRRWLGNPASMANYFYPGIGFGGYCLPKDLNALIQFAKAKKINSKILNSINLTNKNIFKYQLNKILKNTNKNSKIYLLGMSFKPFSDDLRESVSLKFAKKLDNLGYKNLVVCDPLCKKQLKGQFRNVKKIISTPKVEKNSVYILLTAWPKYLEFIKKNNHLKIFDLRYTA